MKILHTSDLHFGISIGNVSLLEDQREMVDLLVRIACEERVGAVLVSGDVFDRTHSSALAIELYDYMATALCVNHSIPLLICAGNHDGAAWLSSCNALLQAGGLYVSGSISSTISPICIGDCNFYLLPWFTLEKARYIYSNQEIRGYDQAFEIILDKIRESFVPDKKNILLAHCFVSGAELVESDRAANIGGASMVSYNIFHGFDYVALGHLHRAQKLGKNVRYSGSPLKYSFDETGRKKSVTIFDTEKNEICEVEILLRRDMRMIKGTRAEILKIAQNDDCLNDYLKIVLTDEYAHQSLREELEQYYSNLIVLEGKVYSGGGVSNSLTVGEIAQLSPMEIMKKFYTELSDGQSPDAEMLAWFEKAVQKAQEEGNF